MFEKKSFFNIKIQKIKDKLKIIPQDKSIVVYASGEHTAKLFEYTDLLSRKIDYIIDKNKYNYNFFGINVKPIDYINDIKPDYIIISSFKFQNEILEFLTYEMNYDGEIIELYDSEDKAPFYKYNDIIYNNTGIFNGNDILYYKIGEIELIMPIEHQLPFILRGCPYYSSNLGRIASYIKEKYNSLTCIDVGANIGDSVAFLRKETQFPILCIEGENDFFNYLKENTLNLPDITLYNSFVGNSTGEIKGSINQNFGTAHVNKNYNSNNKLKFMRLIDIIKQNSRFIKSKLLKIDTDGFDCIILRDSSDFLSIAKPIIFFEYDPYTLKIQNDDGISVFSYLSSIGYRKALFYDNYGEYIFCIDIDNKLILEDIHKYISNKIFRKYYDICVFHEEDEELCKIIREKESRFFESDRNC